LGWFVFFLGDGNADAAERGIGVVNGLQDVEIKLFSARHTNVEPVLLNRIEDLLGIGLQHRLRAREGRVVERGTVDGAEDGLLFFRQCAGRAGQEGGGKKFDVGQIIGLDDLAAQTSAAVGNGPTALVGFVFKLAIQGDGLDLHFQPVLPDKCPVIAAGDAFPLMVGLRRPMNLRARRDHQSARKINVLRNEADNGRLDGR
jgi:hypothetical protein